jgi:hypothetical protein
MRILIAILLYKVLILAVCVILTREISIDHVAVGNVGATTTARGSSNLSLWICTLNSVELIVPFGYMLTIVEKLMYAGWGLVLIEAVGYFYDLHRIEIAQIA